MAALSSPIVSQPTSQIRIHSLRKEFIKNIKDITETKPEQEKRISFSWSKGKGGNTKLKVFIRGEA